MCATVCEMATDGMYPDSGSRGEICGDCGAAAAAVAPLPPEGEGKNIDVRANGPSEGRDGAKAVDEDKSTGEHSALYAGVMGSGTGPSKGVCYTRTTGNTRQQGC